LFSVVLRPELGPREALPVTLVVSLAVATALGKRLPEDVGVKWPNDVVVAGGKIAGILAQSGEDERGERFVVTGVGVNVGSSRQDFPAEIRDTAASCLTESRVSPDRAELFGDVLTTIESYYDRFRTDGFGAFVSSYEERLTLSGRRVRFEGRDGPVAGRVRGVRKDGSLRVETGDGAELALYGETIEVVG
jgi:BirA family biotin operon repressor/biotin-[acetyl-CoA-carboxylase] ligase